MAAKGDDTSTGDGLSTPFESFQVSKSARSLEPEPELAPQGSVSPASALMAMARTRSSSLAWDHDSGDDWRTKETTREGGASLSSSFRPSGGERSPSFFLDDEAREELEQTSPDTVRWLDSRAGTFFQALLILFYILGETVGGIVNASALKTQASDGYTPMSSSLIVMNSGTSIIIGVVLCCLLKRRFQDLSLKVFLDLRAVFRFSIIAALFSCAAIFSMMAYSKLDAGMKKIMDQLRLPLTAALSSVFVGKKYSINEWAALAVLALAVVCFFFADLERQEVTDFHARCKYPPECFPGEETSDFCAVSVEGHSLDGTLISVVAATNSSAKYKIQRLPSQESKTELQGIVFSLVSTILNCVGSLMSEKLMKQTKAPFFVQKAQMETTGFPVAIMMSFLVPQFIDNRDGAAVWWTENENPESGSGFFRGYRYMTLVAIGIDITLSWMGGIVVKQFSSVVKIIAKCFVVLLIVWLSGTIPWPGVLKECHADPVSIPMYSLAFSIALATILFATMPKK
jgi:drug/metabolite transporter (DMT)-like permease